MSAPTDSATARTLAVTELLELILLETDQRTLLTSCVRVCNTWQELITTSSALQKHLYFLPHETQHFSLNPLLDWGFPGWFSKKHWIDPKQWETAYAHCEEPPKPPGYDELSSEERVLNKFLVMPWNVNSEAWRYGKVSWRRMQITQPPVRGFHIAHMGDNLYTEFWRVELEFPNLHDEQELKPLLMGDFYDYIGSTTMGFETEQLECCLRNFCFERPIILRDSQIAPNVQLSLILWIPEPSYPWCDDDYHEEHGTKFRSKAYRAEIQPDLVSKEH
jgi:hypothetical protein